MLRVVSWLIISAVCWLCLSAFRYTDAQPSVQALPINSTLAQFFNAAERGVPYQSFFLLESEEADSNTTLGKILLLDYSAYDTAYASKIRRVAQREVSNATMTEFWEGPSSQLAQTIEDQDIVLVPYASGGDPAYIKSYAKVLDSYVRKGGTVVFFGTHDYTVLQNYGLLELDDSYYVSEPSIHVSRPDHSFVATAPEQFGSSNYAYPLHISDPEYISLADVDNNSVMGYKYIGLGKVVYLGMEYYSDEPIPNKILANVLRSIIPAPPSIYPADRFKVLKRTKVDYFTGGTRPIQFTVKAYPNPYIDKAVFELDLTKTSPVSIEITDELGRIASILLPQRTLVSGYYRFDMPNLDAGIYLVHCHAGDQSLVTKVVKVAQR